MSTNRTNKTLWNGMIARRADARRARTVGIYRVTKSGAPSKRETTRVYPDQADAECERLAGLNPGETWVVGS